MPCATCNDTGHLFDAATGRWARCACMDVTERDRRCREAGIPEMYWPVTVDKLLALSPQLQSAKHTLGLLVEQIKTSGLHGQYCVLGPVRSIRLVGAVLLRAALYRGPGVWAGLDDVTVSYLRDRERVLFERARKAPSLLLLAGQEYPNKMDTHMLCRLLDDRIGEQGTIVASTLTVEHLVERYGDRPVWRGAVQLPAEEFAL